MSPSPGSPDRAAPMAAAPFVYRPDGRPDWGAMWTSFCELALYGGPPHRGPDQALHGDETGAGVGARPELIAEIRRGIWETTGLYAEPGPAGWIAITCESRAMAEWLARAIAPENVDVRREDDRLLLPMGPRFRLDNEVKSLITVVAKTHHYGSLHAGLAADADDVPSHYGFHCPACGLDADVSRPAAAAEGDATCPVDGAIMAARGGVAARRTSFGQAGPARVGVGGSTDAAAALVDALRRRYGRRRAVVTSPRRLHEVNDPAIGLVFVEMGEDGRAPGFQGGMADATIGVLDAAPLDGARDLDVWQLLVLDTARMPVPDRTRFARDVAEMRGGRPLLVADLATAQGVDAVDAWLQDALHLSPWRQRRARSR